MQSALYLGLRKMEWMFLSCHNYWIVCRLVKDDKYPFLAYSRMTSIKDSSEPFRAFLGAILSVIKGVTVEPSAFDPKMGLDTIEDDDDDDDDDPGSILPEDIAEVCPGSSNTGTPPTRGRKRAREEGTESDLMVRPFLCQYWSLI